MYHDQLTVLVAKEIEYPEIYSAPTASMHYKDIIIIIIIIVVVVVVAVVVIDVVVVVVVVVIAN